MGKKVSFEIDKDAVKGPTHQTELTLRQTTEETISAESNSAQGPLVKLEDKAIKDKAESTRVENDKVDKVRVETNRVDLIETPEAKGQSRCESTTTIDSKHR